jgi:DNA-binding transcriptional LysR family regulator
VFVPVVAEGGFAAAARGLDMAPAVVTRAVAELEEHLGARLLQRTTRRLALTEIGEAYLERSRRILAELDEADAVAGASALQPRGSLRILCPPAFAVHRLAKQLPRFRARFPQVALELATPGPVDMADESFDVSIVSVGRQPLQGDFVAPAGAGAHAGVRGLSGADVRGRGAGSLVEVIGGCWGSLSSP